MGTGNTTGSNPAPVPSTLRHGIPSFASNVSIISASYQALAVKTRRRRSSRPG